MVQQACYCSCRGRKRGPILLTREDDQPASSSSNSGFISLMDSVDSPMFSATPTGARHTSSAPPPSHHNDLDDEEDDLGLGNSAFRKKPKAAENGDASDPAPAKEEEKPKAAAPEKPGTFGVSAGPPGTLLTARRSSQRSGRPRLAAG